LKKEKEKLKMELQRSQSSMDVGQCEVIQHLLGVTDIVANTLPEKSNAKKVDSSDDEKHSNHEEHTTKQTNTYVASRFVISCKKPCMLHLYTIFFWRFPINL
jgi:hypothetical protein